LLAVGCVGGLSSCVAPLPPPPLPLSYTPSFGGITSYSTVVPMRRFDCYGSTVFGGGFYNGFSHGFVGDSCGPHYSGGGRVVLP
jgi:hypothetical protein